MSPARAITYLMSGALMAGALGLEFHRRQTSTRERARLGLLRDDAELFTDALATSLRLPEACGAMFKDVKLEPGARQALALNYAYDPRAETPLRAGGEAWPGTQLKHLDLEPPKDPDLRTIYQKRVLRRFRGRIDAEFVIKDRFPTGVPASLEVYVWLDDDNALGGCFGPLSTGAFCNMAGGYYDADEAKTERRCHLLRRTSVETADARVYRGTCRVSGIAPKASACAGGAKNAVAFQEKMGYRTSKQVLCQVCD